MNAYELADLMLDVTDCESSEYYQAGLMLRHQADYIKHLEDGLKASIALNKAQLERLAKLSKNVDELEEELLKTPQIKELNDEEIEEVFQENIRQPNFMMLGDTQRFARAILKKASEK